MATSKPSVAPGADVSRLNQFHALRGQGVNRTSVIGLSGGHGFESPYQTIFLTQRHSSIPEF